MEKILSFLKDLKANNNREWFTANKKKYESARKTFEDLLNRLIPEIQKIDPSIGTPTAKECMFRIYRDVRFSKDKSPYKTNMGAYIAQGGRKGMHAGYYLHLEPGGSFLAGGVHMPPGDVLKKLRHEIMYNIDEFKSIIENPEFKKHFEEFYGEKLSRPPQGFPADFPEIDLLKYKSYTVVNSFDAAVLNQDQFIKHAISVYSSLYPFNRFLNRGLD
ncbi:MAG: DUF2461 domain-containing protein [Bacteroidales bacterium]|nr:DUF2461 domain-containing protein [Bacteroidales bacterium]